MVNAETRWATQRNLEPVARAISSILIPEARSASAKRINRSVAVDEAKELMTKSAS
jgi:hypothetical protein